jgi:RNA polymerase sigma factor (TIGR02999 family)
MIHVFAPWLLCGNGRNSKRPRLLHSALRCCEGKTVMEDEFSAAGQESPWHTPLPDDSLPEDRRAFDGVFSAAYEELRRLASTVRRRDPGTTLSPTTLVNEAWLKLSKSPAVGSTSPLHFKRIAARAMRQVLVTAARRRTGCNRADGPVTFVTLDDTLPDATSCDGQMLALDAALEELARMNPRQAMLVEGRFFGGLEASEMTSLLGVSEATILRDWRAARAWLALQLSQQA